MKRSRRHLCGDFFEYYSHVIAKPSSETFLEGGQHSPHPYHETDELLPVLLVEPSDMVHVDCIERLQGRVECIDWSHLRPGDGSLVSPTVDEGGGLIPQILHFRVELPHSLQVDFLLSLKSVGDIINDVVELFEEHLSIRCLQDVVPDATDVSGQVLVLGDCQRREEHVRHSDPFLLVLLVLQDADHFLEGPIQFQIPREIEFPTGVDELQILDHQLGLLDHLLDLRELLVGVQHILLFREVFVDDDVIVDVDEVVDRIVVHRTLLAMLQVELEPLDVDIGEPFFRVEDDCLEEHIHPVVTSQMAETGESTVPVHDGPIVEHHTRHPLSEVLDVVLRLLERHAPQARFSSLIPPPLTIRRYLVRF